MVGLGNPGAEFEGTRHNAGADAVRLLAERHGGRLRSEKGLSSLACEVRLGGRKVMLAIPLTYMNESGLAVTPLVRRAGLEEDGAVGSHLIVVHDELDLPPGRVKMKSGGGHAGNNGLKSIERHLHTGDYLRVRIGIGKPAGRQSGADYVLKRPARAERELLQTAIEQAADAVESIADVGFDATMSRVNAVD
ncbi:MAG: aminoacyl-tRNA hydrolase [Acidimicrobiales bacterium]